MTEDKIKEIHKERNKLFTIPYIIDFDKRWREMQQLFRGINADLSKIQIAVERKKANEMRVEMEQILKHMEE